MSKYFLGHCIFISIIYVILIQLQFLFPHLKLRCARRATSCFLTWASAVPGW